MRRSSFCSKRIRLFQAKLALNRLMERHSKYTFRYELSLCPLIKLLAVPPSGNNMPVKRLAIAWALILFISCNIDTANDLNASLAFADPVVIELNIVANEFSKLWVNLPKVSHLFSQKSRLWS